MVALRAPAEPDLTYLHQRRHDLEALLVDGWRQIDAAVLAGRDVVDAEHRWMRLLGEYERVCAALRCGE
jgi:hypothetical protein